MKSQAWGWLATAVLTAGLNSSYHNGGLRWIHEAADRVQHNTNAILPWPPVAPTSSWPKRNWRVRRVPPRAR